jgi:hypothetical protein
MICVFVSSFMIWGCAAPRIIDVIDLSRDRYTCKMDPTQFSQYQGKRVLLAPIRNRSKNTTDLFYYNSERTVGYRSYSSASADPQPVGVYFWYGLQKAFGCAGIRIEGNSTDSDAELALTLYSLTDEEVIFTADLIKEGKYTHSREYTVKMPKMGRFELREQRAFGMLDAMVTAMLHDQKFEQVMLKFNVPNIRGNQNYENLKGIVLKNGTVIKGEILNKEEIKNMQGNTVQIRTEQGRVVSYSFNAVLFFY